MSESTAFEVAYNIFGGPGVPVFFAIWDQAPIKTTLLRDLNEIAPVRYMTFSNPAELTKPLLDFFGTYLKNSRAKIAPGPTSETRAVIPPLRKIPWRPSANGDC